jgi:aspartate aminotransferase-like enzyme
MDVAVVHCETTTGIVNPAEGFDAYLAPESWAL